MIERFINDIALKVRSRTGASAQASGMAVAGAFFVVTALIFLSLAAYAGLLPIYGSAVAWLIVGGAHLVIAAAFMTAFMITRRRTRAAALAQIEAAARQNRQSAWKIDPNYLAVGIEVAKVVGIKNLIPLVIGGLVAAGWGGSRRGSKPTGRN